MTKTIWFVNHYSYPNNVYPHQRTNNYAKLFQRDGYEVRVFCSSFVHRTSINLIANNFKSEELIDEIPYTIIKTSKYDGNGLKRILNIAQFFFGFLRKAKHYPIPDIIVATTVHPLAPLASLFYSKNKTTKVITEIADLWPEIPISFGMLSRYNPITLFLYKLEQHLYLKSHKLIFTMEGFKDYLNERSFSDEVQNKSLYLNNSMSCSELINGHEKIHLNGDSSSIRFLYFGALGEANAVDMLVGFIQKTKLLFQNKVEFHIFGHGSNRNQLKEMEDTSQVYLYDSVPKNCLAHIAEQVDFLLIFTKPSAIYRLGYSMNKLFDYFCLEKPIIHNLYGDYDLITNYQIGYRYSFEEGLNHDSFVDYITNYSSNQELMESFKSRVSALNREFDISVQYSKLKKFLEI